MRFLPLLAGLLAGTGLWAGVAEAKAAGPVVETQTGAVEGVEEKGLSVFRAIPFAAPPVGALRWRPPQDMTRWQGVRSAKAFGSPCMQEMAPALQALGETPSEDCLTLNIWTPRQPGEEGSRLPVLVWIHGGAFRGGTAADPRIAGDLLARRGIIVVTVQYRLGVFGFLSHPQLSAEEGGASGNYGLMDQIAALRWVQDNIAAFGGDPGKVTVGGLSAGAISAAILAAAPQARGLFRGLISMSGGSFAPPRSPAEAGENMEPLTRSEHNGERFAAALGMRDIAVLRAAPPERLLSVDRNGVSWPVVDGKIIRDDEYRLFTQGRIADVPLLLGSTSGEGYVFSRIRSLADYRAEVVRRYGNFAPEILRGYPAASDEEAVRQARALTRDVMFGWGTWAWANLQKRYGSAPVHVYYFDHLAPQSPPDAGAVHGSDQPYPFGIAHQDRPWTPIDYRLSDAMLGYFANFVRNGDPNGANLPDWPAFSHEEQQALHITDDLAVGPVANRPEIELIDRYMAIRRKDGGLGAPR